jgi:hypothetical protein
LWSVAASCGLAQGNRDQGLQVVETRAQSGLGPGGENAAKGELVVMNRTGSTVIQDLKGRDRERHPIVYGARLKVRDGAHCEQGTSEAERRGGGVF